MLFLCIGSIHDQFCGSLTMYGIVHFVLDFFKEQFCCRSITVIANCSGINIGKFLIKKGVHSTLSP